MNVINQKALPLLKLFAQNGYGIIARMPLQFGLLANKFKAGTSFPQNDHRSQRLTPEIISKSNALLAPLWDLAEQYETTPVGISLSYILSYPEISTVIPGIRTKEQVISNVNGLIQLKKSDRALLEKLYHTTFINLLGLMQSAG